MDTTKCILFVFFITLSTANIVAQKINVDSLTQVAQTTTDDSLKVYTFNKIASAYRGRDVDTALMYNDWASAVLDQYDNEKLRLWTINTRAAIHWRAGNTDSALYYFQYLVRHDTVYRPAEAAANLRRVAEIHNETGSFDSALFYFQKGLPYALKYSTNEQIEYNVQLAMLYNNWHDCETGINYAREAVRLVELHKPEKDFGAYNNVGVLHMCMQNYDSADYYYTKGYEYADYPEDSPMHGIFRHNLAYSMESRGEKQRGIQMFKEAIEYKLKYNSSYSISQAYYALAEVYVEIGEFDSCLMYSKKSMELSQERNDKRLIKRNHGLQSDAYAGLGKLDEYFYHKNYFVRYTDSLFNDSRTQTIAELEAKYENQKQQAENLKLTIQNSEIEGRSSRQKWIIGFILLLLVFMVIAVVIINKNRKRTEALNLKISDQANQLEEALASQERFFSNITHEFRTPLTLILSPIESVLAKPFEEIKIRQLLRNVHRHSNQLLVLVNQLLEISKLKAGNLPVNARVGDLSTFMGQLVDGFRPAADENEVELKFVNENVSGLYAFDMQKWERILSNLISNALKFTQNGSVSIYLKEQDKEHTVQIVVSDTGSGIQADDLEKIFDRFYQSSDEAVNARGTGIGLSLVKELVDLLQGEITVQSSTTGTRFTLSLPAEKSTKISVEDALPASFYNEFKNVSKENATLLVVDDNTELRTFLRKQLEENYTTLEAKDGLEGWKIIEERLPDIVVSDVMMPGLQGDELVRRAKDNPKTSHIRFILLTAKASKDAVIQGLESGADDYITKPFHPHELQLRVHNAWSSLSAYRNHLRSEVMPNQVDKAGVEIANIDDVFIKELFSYVKENMQNNSLSTEMMADHMSVSKSTLNRKLRATLDTSSLDFIRNVRLSQSLEYLKAGNTISQAAYAVGFESASYYAKIFKARFQKTPSEYLGDSNT